MHLSTISTWDISNHVKRPLSSHTSLVYPPLRAAAVLEDARTRVNASSVAPVHVNFVTWVASTSRAPGQVFSTAGQLEKSISFKLFFRGTCSYWPILNDGLAPIGRHAIIWTNDGLLFWDCFLINKYLLKYGQIYIKTSWVDRMDWHRAGDKTLSEPIIA